MQVELHGYEYSVYSWIARLALIEKGVEHAWNEINPFEENLPANYLRLNPFKRVPTLVHNDFVVYETNAITRYVDEAFDGPLLQRTLPVERARCHQIMSVVDSYAYWPLIRQVFSHGVFRSRLGRPAQTTEVRQGLDAAPRVLAALEKLTGSSQFLCGNEMSLADIHLAPMLGYFTLLPKANALLDGYPRLRSWWSAMSRQSSVQATMPQLPNAAS